MAGLVRSDASPLIGLARVEAMYWLRQLFGVASDFRISASVIAEVLRRVNED
jgi:hypothetical protein